MKIKLISMISLIFVAAFTIILPTDAHLAQASPVYNANDTVHAGYARKSFRVRYPEFSASRINLPVGTEESSNWAGYAVTRSDSLKYTSVDGSWVVPVASGSSSSLGSQWIGLGGISSGDLLQMGTIEQFQGNREVATLFWEQLPANAQDIMTVPVGSRIYAKIYQGRNNTWYLQFQVIEPNGKKATKNISVNSAKLNSTYAQGIGTSAEWISEDPSNGSGNLYPLANTGVVQYANTTANNKAINSKGNKVEPLAVVNALNRLLITPSSLSSNGTNFSTTNIGNRYVSLRAHGIHHFRGGRHKIGR
ncbi:G1 family glutamic endopeptidase [Sporolactobacillus pectinivorans]|uniref:G1 family glutamic endopeptidase n=1 Tax=Sporolactobacillus pectinivorans TaxID=1591408 RepID=UPI000C25B481|nr:G1 family glutamic endopeptidase [Sporolactobacillus pectinivorans]